MIAADFARTRERPWAEVLEFAESLPPRSVVLDLGCGGGRHASVLSDWGHQVFGLDASAKLVAIARHRAPGATIVQGDLCALPFRDGTFSAAIAVAAIHHLPSEAERAGALREMGRILADGGRAFLTVWAFEQPRFEQTLIAQRARPTSSFGDVWVPWRAGGREVQRFYHLFVDEELPHLVLDSGLCVERYFRSGENYVVVAERRG